MLPIALALLVAGAQDIRGELEEGDFVYSDGRLHDVHTFEWEAPGSMILTLESRDFDPFLAIRGPEGFSVDVDNSDGPRAWVCLVLPRSGEYQVQVTSTSEGEHEGRYELEVEPEAHMAVLTLRGRLEADDASYDDGSRYDMWPFYWPEGYVITVTMEGGGFDAWVSLNGPNDMSVSSDDADGTNSWLGAIVPRAGQHTIVVSSGEPGQGGPYAVQVQFQQGFDAWAFEDGLERTDTTLADGEYRDRYSFYLPAGRRVIIMLDANGFQPYLHAAGPEDWSVTAQGVQGPTRMLDFEARESGHYDIYVSSQNAGERGGYRLTVMAQDDP